MSIDTDSALRFSLKATSSSAKQISIPTHLNCLLIIQITLSNTLEYSITIKIYNITPLTLIQTDPTYTNKQTQQTQNSAIIKTI